MKHNARNIREMCQFFSHAGKYCLVYIVFIPYSGVKHTNICIIGIHVIFVRVHKNIYEYMR